MNPSEIERGKSVFSSRTIHFNVWTWAVWPFLPKSFKENPDAPMILGAWITIGNIILRFLTTEALTWRKGTDGK